MDEETRQERVDRRNTDLWRAHEKLAREIELAAETAQEEEAARETTNVHLLEGRRLRNRVSRADLLTPERRYIVNLESAKKLRKFHGDVLHTIAIQSAIDANVALHFSPPKNNVTKIGFRKKKPKK